MEESGEDLYFKQIEVGPMQNYAYLIGSRQNAQAMVVDPGWQGDYLLSLAAKDRMRIVGVLATHCHYDHVNALDELLSANDCPVYVHSLDAPQMQRWAAHLKPVEDAFEWKLGETLIKAIHTPGHTEGSQCFLSAGRLISGDTLFVNACGRCDLPGGSARRLSESLQRLWGLPDEILLCPGHDYGGRPTDTMGAQKKTNPYLRRAGAAAVKKVH